ncbi:MAG: hypothetical protein JSR81_10105 [Proteobacteria bacterium]|nr:hypothetical protein [Pseudomonadota bacterium]
MTLRLPLCAGIFLLLASPAFAADHVLDIDNRVGKFETFYAHATARPVDADARFKLWQAEDGLAAVPPGPEGDAMARKLLDDAWSRYPALIPKLDALEKTAEATAREMFAKDNEILGTATNPIHTRLILYVGQFDNNAFTVPPMNGKPATILMPVENINLKIALAHELTHSIELQLVPVKNSFGAPVGETMFLEGLAMRTSQRAVPGLPDAAYTSMPDEKTWWSNCVSKKDAVMKAIVPDLDKSGQKIAMKYTFGQGNTGMQREAYCAAWFVMGKLLASGKTLPELARVPEDRMVATIRAAMKTE